MRIADNRAMTIGFSYDEEVFLMRRDSAVDADLMSIPVVMMVRQHKEGVGVGNAAPAGAFGRND